MLDAPPAKIPALPEFGKLRGKRVSLKEAPDRLSAADLEQVEVDIPGQGIIRPWRFSSSVGDFKFEERGDGTLIL